MGNESFLEKLASQFGQNASVKNVFGEPIQTGDKTIIPVAQIAYGLGGGYGHGRKVPKGITAGVSENDKNIVGEGSGGGGGMYAKPKGVYEITAHSTRFIPATNFKTLFLGLGVGIMLRALLSRKRVNKGK